MPTRSTIPEAVTQLFDLSVDVHSTVDRHFSPAFRQRAGAGPWIDRDEFARRIAALRDAATSVRIVAHDELVDGDRYAERHTIEVLMPDGTSSRTEVYVFGRHDADGRFVEIHEATLSLVDAGGTQQQKS